MRVIGVKRTDYIRHLFFFSKPYIQATLQTSHTLDQSENATIVSVLFVLSQKRHDDSDRLQSQATKNFYMYKTREWNR